MSSDAVYAPIALFVYNRLDHLKQVIHSLQNNKESIESELFIFSDGPKNEQSIDQVNQLRTYLSQITAFKKVHIINQNKNLGLAASIIQGVTQLVNEYEKVIVIEDDLILSPYFLKFMNDGLRIYANDPVVASIHGYAFPLKETMPKTYFMKGADCWGWATWKRAWQHFEADGVKLLNNLVNLKLTKEFDFDHSQPNMQMLKNQIAGKNNSWAIRWHASTFIKGMLTLYPGKSLVRNIGLDNSGEHCAATNIYDVEPSTDPIPIEPIPLVYNRNAYEIYVKFFKNLREPLYKKILKKVKKLINS